MRILLVVCLFCFLNFNGFTQQTINLACKDFTFNEKIFNQGQNLRRLFESSLIKSGFPFKIIEREEMTTFFNHCATGVGRKTIPIANLSQKRKAVLTH